MSGPLFRVTCQACGWSSHTRFSQPGPNHKCPMCQSPKLVMAPHGAKTA